MIVIRNKKGPFKRPKKKKEIVQQIILDNFIRIPMPYHLEQEIQNKFTILNPDFMKEVKRRRLARFDWPKCGYIEVREKVNYKWNTRRIYQRRCLWKYDGSDLVIPRGSMRQLKAVFDKYNKVFKLVDKREAKPRIEIPFISKLMPEKGQLPFENWYQYNGILVSGTGTGKTVLALYQAHKFEQPTLIIVDTYELQKQWVNRIVEHTGIVKKDIGLIGGGKQIVKSITVGLIQTLSKDPELTNEFGFLIIDEVHMTSERYYKTMEFYKGPYCLGLTATPKKDSTGQIQEAYFGPISMELSKKKAERLPAQGFVVLTNYRGGIPFKYKYSQALAAMLADETRNQLIIDTVINHIEIYGIHLIISRSSKQLHTLHGMMPHHISLTARVITGKVSKKERRQIVLDAMENKLKFIFATDRILEKGFDEELLSVLHIVSPKAGEDKIEQGCGRVRRIPKKDHQEVRENKKMAYIFYYYDRFEMSLGGAFSAVKRVFKRLEIPIEQLIKKS